MKELFLKIRSSTFFQSLKSLLHPNIKFIFFKFIDWIVNLPCNFSFKKIIDNCAIGGFCFFLFYGVFLFLFFWERNPFLSKDLLLLLWSVSPFHSWKSDQEFLHCARDILSFRSKCLAMRKFSDWPAKWTASLQVAQLVCTVNNEVCVTKVV